MREELLAEHVEVELGLVVANRRDAAEGVTVLDVVRRGGGQLPEWEPGAHIDLLLTDGVIRPYSLCGDHTDRVVWSIGILLAPASRGGSNYGHQRLIKRGICPGARATQSLCARALAKMPLHRRWHRHPARCTHVRPPSGRGQCQLVYGGYIRKSRAFAEAFRQYGQRVSVQTFDELGHIDLATVLSAPAVDTLVECFGPEGLLGAVEAQRAGSPGQCLDRRRKGSQQPHDDLRFAG